MTPIIYARTAPHRARPAAKFLGHAIAVLGIAALGWALVAGTAASGRRPLKIIVPFGAGGGSDTFVRLIQKAIDGQNLADRPWVIINQKGGSGTIGSRAVMTAPADGHTVLNLHEAIMTAKLSGKVPYGPEAFEPIAATGRVSMTVVVPAGSRFESLKQLMDEAKRTPETISFGANVGAPAHFAGLLLENAAPGAKFNTIQSGGGQQRYSLLIGGHLEVAVFSLDEYLNYSSDGKIRALAILDADPNPAVANVPTARAQGYDVVHHNTQYWWAPKGTPAPRIDAVADVLEKAMQSPQVLSELARTHTEPLFVRGEPLRNMIAARMQTLSRVDLRHETNLPNFPLWTGLIVAALAVWVAAAWLKSQPQTSTPGAGVEAETAPNHKRAWAIAALSLAYAAALQFRLLRFAVATTLFVFVAGLILASRQPRKPWAALSETALLCGLGLEFVFSRLLVIDLP